MAAAGGDPSGWKLPEWTLESDQAFNERHNIGTSILSLTAPGAALLGGKEAATLARQSNEYCAAIRDAHPSKYGFFAALPSLLETQAALDEVAYALDTLKADGIVLFTRYGTDNHYLGHADFQLVWDELDRRHAVVFIHPTSPADATPANRHLPLPVVDYPHETTRTAVDLIMNGVIRAHKNCKIILSHAGGTLPYLAGRAANFMPILDAPCNSADDFLQDAKTLYYDIALSGTELTLSLLHQFAHPDHILFGSDYPYAQEPAIAVFNKSIDGFKMDNETRLRMDRGNALKLFPRLQKLANL